MSREEYDKFLKDAAKIASTLNMTITHTDKDKITLKSSQKKIWFLYTFRGILKTVKNGDTFVKLPEAVRRERAKVVSPYRLTDLLLQVGNLPWTRRDSSRGYWLISNYGGIVFRVQPVVETSTAKEALKLELESLFFYQEKVDEAETRLDMENIFKRVPYRKLIDASYRTTVQGVNEPWYYTFHRSALNKQATNKVKSQFYNRFVQYPRVAQEAVNFVKGLSSNIKTKAKNLLNHGFKKYINFIADLEGAPESVKALKGLSLERIDTSLRHGVENKGKGVNVQRVNGTTKKTVKLRSYIPGSITAIKPRAPPHQAVSLSVGKIRKRVQQQKLRKAQGVKLKLRTSYAVKPPKKNQKSQSTSPTPLETQPMDTSSNKINALNLWSFLSSANNGHQRPNTPP